MDRSQFKKRPVTERIDFVTNEKFFKKFLFKTHAMKDYIFKRKCRANSSGKKLQQEPTATSAIGLKRLKTLY